MPEIVGQDEGTDADPLSDGSSRCQRSERPETAREMVGDVERVVAKDLDSVAFLPPLLTRVDSAKLNTKAKWPVRQQVAPGHTKT